MCLLVVPSLCYGASDSIGLCTCALLSSSFGHAVLQGCNTMNFKPGMQVNTQPETSSRTELPQPASGFARQDEAIAR